MGTCDTAWLSYSIFKHNMTVLIIRPQIDMIFAITTPCLTDPLGGGVKNVSYNNFFLIYAIYIVRF